MSIVFRREKGAPLTAGEVDDNFQELLDRIQRLESASPGIQQNSVQVDGDFVLIKDVTGRTLSQSRLPFLGLKPLGDWQQERPYGVNDLVNRPEATYICTQSHQPEAFNPEHWQVLAPFIKKGESL